MIYSSLDVFFLCYAIWKDFFINNMNNRFLKILSIHVGHSLHGHVNNNTSGRYNQTTCHNRWGWQNNFLSCFSEFPDLAQQQGMRRRVRTDEVRPRSMWTSAHARETFSARVAALTPSVPHPALSLCNSFVSPLPSYRLGARTHTVRSHIFSRETFSLPLSLSFIFPIALHLCHPRPLHAWEELVEGEECCLFG